MNHRVFVVAALVSASAVASFLSACGDDATTTDGGQDATTDAATGGDAGSDALGAGDGEADSGDGAASSCVGSDAGCRACCAALYPAGSAFFRQALKTCACGDAGVCDTNGTCGGPKNLCSGGDASAACAQCLTGNCVTPAGEACAADQACAPFAACASACAADGG